MKVKALLMLLSLWVNPSSAKVSIEEFNIFVSEFTNFINPYTRDAGASRTYNLILIPDRNFSAWFRDPIEISQGVLDHTSMTVDALALVACHEIGHDVSMAKKFLPNTIVFGWNHLLQDYFASYSCIKPFLKHTVSFRHPNLTKNQMDEIPLELQTKCETFNSSEVDVKICLRALHASISVIKGLYDHKLFREEYSRNDFAAPAFDREWIGPGDHLQGRLITFKNGVFGEEPFTGPY